MIRFTAPDAFEARPLYEVFDPKLWHANYADGAFFKDKIVMVGPSAQVLHDLVDTPLSTTTLGPGLHLQAMAAASEPAPGSDMLIDITVPDEIALNAVFFCCSLPARL